MANPRKNSLVPTFRSSYPISAVTFYELRKAMGTSKVMILVPLFDLKSLGSFRRLRCRDFKSAALALFDDAIPFAIRTERASDGVAREALLDACFGASRQQRTCQRLRDGRAPAEGLSFSAVSGRRLVGTIRLWHVNAGGAPALVLGPLAVDPSCRGLGIGAALVHHALATARALGHGAVILLGDAPYYGRFGF